MKYKYTLYQLNLETEKREPIAVKHSINEMHLHIISQGLDDIPKASFRYYVSNCMHFYFGKTFIRNGKSWFPLSVTRIPVHPKV